MLRQLIYNKSYKLQKIKENKHLQLIIFIHNIYNTSHGVLLKYKFLKIIQMDLSIVHDS